MAKPDPEPVLAVIDDFAELEAVIRQLDSPQASL